MAREKLVAVVSGRFCLLLVLGAAFAAKGARSHLEPATDLRRLRVAGRRLAAAGHHAGRGHHPPGIGHHVLVATEKALPPDMITTMTLGAPAPAPNAREAPELFALPQTSWAADLPSTMPFGGPCISNCNDTTLQYFGGPVMSRPIKVYLLWYGAWSLSETTSTIEFVKSISFPRPPTYYGFDNSTPSVKEWWAIVTSLTDQDGQPVTGDVRVGGFAGLGYQFGRALDANAENPSGNDIAGLLQKSLGTRLPLDKDGIYFVLVSPDVLVTDFSYSNFGYRASLQLQGTEIKYIFMQNPQFSPGPSPFYPMASGLDQFNYHFQPDQPYPPASASKGIDALIATVATFMAGTASDPVQPTGWAGPASENMLDIGQTTCYYYGILQNTSKGYYNMIGAHGSKFILPEIYDIRTADCELQATGLGKYVPPPYPPFGPQGYADTSALPAMSSMAQPPMTNLEPYTYGDGDVPPVYFDPTVPQAPLLQALRYTKKHTQFLSLYIETALATAVLRSPLTTKYTIFAPSDTALLPVYPQAGKSIDFERTSNGYDVNRIALYQTIAGFYTYSGLMTYHRPRALCTLNHLKEVTTVSRQGVVYLRSEDGTVAIIDQPNIYNDGRVVIHGINHFFGADNLKLHIQ